MKFHAITAKIAQVKYKVAKTIGLGICYGMGEAKLCNDMGLPTEQVWSKRRGEWIDVAGPEGKALLKRFHGAVPFLRGLSDFCMSRAEARGFVRTILGRRCQFERDRQRVPG